MLPVQSIDALKWDLGLPDQFEKTQHFQVVMASNGVPSLRLAEWFVEFAGSALQKSKNIGQVLVFAMTFRRGY